MTATDASKSALKGLTTWGINRIGHKVGYMIAENLWKRPAMQRLIASHPAGAKLIAEGLVGLTSMLELGGDHPLVRLLNNISEVIATESVEIIGEMESDPELAKQKIETVVATKLESEVLLVLEHVHKSNTCLAVQQYMSDTTPPERKGKDDKVIKDPSRARILTTTLQEALAAGKPLCGLCYPSVTVSKTETKTAGHGLKPEPKPGSGSLFDLLVKLEAEEPYMFATISPIYRSMTAKDLDLKKKFFQAFHNNGSYEDFKTVLRQSPSLWDEWLDDYLGEPTPEKGVLARERQETEEMILAFLEQLEKVPPVFAAWGASVKNSGQKAKQERLERVRKREIASRRNRYIMGGVALLGLIAFLHTNGVF